MTDQDISTLPLSTAAISSLLQSGYKTLKNLEGVKPLELSREIGCTADEAISILKSIQSFKDVPIKSISAKDYLSKRDIGRPIITFCKSLDQLIGGGIPIGTITELVGIPGVGKTQLCMQLAMDIQIPEIFGGNGGEAIYIDTEGSFMIDRAIEMALALSTHIENLATTKLKKQPDLHIELSSYTTTTTTMTSDRFLEGIHLYRIHESIELIAVINQLSAFLKTHTKIKLIIIDSIAYHFRSSIHDNISKSRILSTIAQTLNQLAFEFNVAIVITNHVTTRFITSSSSSSSSATLGMNHSSAVEGVQTSGSTSSSTLIPALGDIWSHCITNRIMLHFSTQPPIILSSTSPPATTSYTPRRAETIVYYERIAEILKSPCWPMSRASFIICSSGIRDVNHSQLRREQQRLLQEKRISTDRGGTTATIPVLEESRQVKARLT